MHALWFLSIEPVYLGDRDAGQMNLQGFIKLSAPSQLSKVPAWPSSASQGESLRQSRQQIPAWSGHPCQGWEGMLGHIFIWQKVFSTQNKLWQKGALKQSRMPVIKYDGASMLGFGMSTRGTPRMCLTLPIPQQMTCIYIHLSFWTTRIYLDVHLTFQMMIR
ncbi:hypothetical protein EDC04DRAFT_2604121 [Pisolithus marmoratus]|nr:hypothetical protein EDC04DRAFT_2604121 [Pisolithus marmoratus]